MLCRRPPRALAALFTPIALTCVAAPAQARIHMGAEYGEPVPPKPAPAEDPAAAFTWGVGARAGYFGGPVFGEGLEVFRRVGDWSLGVSAYDGAADLTDALADRSGDVPALAGFDVESAKVRSTLVQIEARRSVLGPVDARIGLGYRTVAGKLALAAEDGSGRWRADAEVASVVAAGTICSYWTWSSGFYAGFDWIGIDVPIASSHDVDTTSDPTVAESSRSALEDQAEELARQLAESPGIILLVAALGYRF
jgi:hypothetical protein